MRIYTEDPDRPAQERVSMASTSRPEFVWQDAAASSLRLAEREAADDSLTRGRLDDARPTVDPHAEEQGSEQRFARHSSPQTPTQILLLCAASTTPRINRRMAGMRRLVEPGDLLITRSTAIVYWIRSLEPMLKKSTSGGSSRR